MLGLRVNKARVARAEGSGLGAKSALVLKMHLPAAALIPNIGP